MNSESASQEPTVQVHVNIEIAAVALQAVVHNTKLAAGRDNNGHYRVDTADKLGEMISQFLAEKNFTAYAAESDRYV